MIGEVVRAAIGVFVVFNVVAISVLVLVLLERKFLGRLQQRFGPTRVGPHGILQTVADALKLLLKEDFTPARADRLLFQAAPFLVIVPIFLPFVAIPFAPGLVVRSLEFGLLYVVAMPVVSALGFFLAGWASDNKYALIGAVRYAAVLVSYELPMLIGVIGVVMVTGTLNLVEIVEQQAAWPLLFAQLPAFLLFLIGGMTEGNRTPFDIAIAESEVVGGPFVEYSGMRWSIFYLAEYASIFATAALTTLLFLGGWHGPLLPPLAWFLIKTSAVVIIIFWMRGTMPRLRIDQLMSLAWKGLIPVAFLNLVVTGVAVLVGGPGPGSPLVILGGLATTAVALAAFTAALRPQRRSDVRLGTAAWPRDDLANRPPAARHYSIP
ncbi:MAG: NADH-quinone oxidoreductase subunit NuoH [Chloroflexota bacterium]|nr:NADH-quinone oxidoreductase subunit NuoH [Dehalococcoidia bacterium]MDW8254863.1 NADH-quinone oxidoreductase subunit NuoH [Chloroflexota bacterium]